MTWRAISACPNPSALVRALGMEVVQKRVTEGEREAQWSLGFHFFNGAVKEARELVADEVGAAELGAASRTPMAEVGLY